MTIVRPSIAVVATCVVFAVPPLESSARDTDAMLRAFASGDRAALERAAIASSAGGIHQKLESNERQAMIAASLAAPLVADAPLLLEPLAIAANSSDRTIALGAARAALRILSETPPERFSELEVTRSTVAGALRRWHEVARDGTRWSDVRVISLEISRDLADQLASKPAAPLLELITDADPEVRRAAYELLPSPLPSEHVRRIAEAAARETDRAVAVAGAGSVCGPLAHGDAGDPAALLGEAGIAQIADLVLDVSLGEAARLAAAHCLASAPAASSVLGKLPATLDPSLRDAARRIGRGRDR